MKKLDTKEFIEKSREKHGDKYDYSKSIYLNSRTKIEIICKEHGSFWQLPRNHYKEGQGCPICAKRLQNPTRTVEEFIKEAQKIHGNKYNYSKVINPSSGNKVCIICPEHGEFWQYTNNHLQNCGCPKCSNHKPLNTQEFINRAKEIHKDLSYDKTVYTNARTNVIITCPIHGDFEQNPQTHLKGCGCPNCKTSKGEALCKEILVKYKIPFKHQFRLINEYFEDKTLIVDFFIKYNGKQYFIEYNGRQHYEPIDFFGGEEQYKKQVIRDNLLKSFCSLYKDKVSLLEIPYWEDNVESVILKFLNYEERV